MWASLEATAADSLLPKLILALAASVTSRADVMMLSDIATMWCLE